jgi:hypothetical protein
MTNAATIAEKSIGNNSKTLSISLDTENGTLVYDILVMNSTGELHKVISDPADGKLLLSRELSDLEANFNNQGILMEDPPQQIDHIPGNNMILTKECPFVCKWIDGYGWFCYFDCGTGRFLLY